jgi:hypothetical protein
VHGVNAVTFRQSLFQYLPVLREVADVVAHQDARVDRLLVAAPAVFVATVTLIPQIDDGIEIAAISVGTEALEGIGVILRRRTMKDRRRDLVAQCLETSLCVIAAEKSEGVEEILSRQAA